jgi:hypothetical protein
MGNGDFGLGELPDLLQGIGEMFQARRSEEDPAKDVIPSMEFDKNGQPRYNIELGAQAMQTLLHVKDIAENTVASYSQEMAQLEQREDYTRQHGLFNLLSNLAGNFAQAKEMPGWVNALGKTSTDLNPTPDALMRQRMALQPGLMGALQQETMAAGQMIDLERNRIADERTEIAAEKALKVEISDLEKVYDADARNKMFDRETSKAQMMARGVPEWKVDITVDHFEKKQQLYDDHKKALTLLDRKEDIDKETRDFNNAVKLLDVKKKNDLEVQAARPKAAGKIDQPVLEDATKWLLPDGSNPKGVMSPREIMDAGGYPVGVLSLEDQKRFSDEAFQQMFGLIDSLEKKSLLASGTDVFSVGWTSFLRKMFPGDPDMNTLTSHGGSVVAIQRILGDKGPRAMAAFKGAMDMVDKATSAAAVRQTMVQLKAQVDAILSGKVKTWDQAEKVTGGPIGESAPAQDAIGPDGKTHHFVLEKGAWVDKGVI